MILITVCNNITVHYTLLAELKIIIMSILLIVCCIELVCVVVH